MAEQVAATLVEAGEDDDATEPDTRLRLSFVRVLVAFLLTALSMLGSFKFGTLELSGGPHLVALAAVVLLWPIFQMLLKRGGSTEMFGVKFDVNKLEQHNEREYGVRIEELRGEVEQLRELLAEVSPDRATIPPPADPERAAAEFREAVRDYAAHQDARAGWRGRIAVDKRLSSGALRVGATQLRELLAEADSQHAAMAAAVLLGIRTANENADEVAELLGDLLGSEYERVRYRAARAIERRAKRGDTPAPQRERFRRALRRAEDVEPDRLVRGAIESALDAVD